MSKAETPPGEGRPVEIKIVCTNRKARHLYHILDTWEAGLVLTGTEVKSLRAGHATMADAYADLHGTEMTLHNLHINPYEQGNRWNHLPTRPRKLLLHKRELSKLIGRTVEKGLTLIPLQVYFRGGWAKVEIALGRGKKVFDKRRDMAEREMKRDVERTLKERQR
ncbi:MAG: SsrA-binding protein SmpB [Candidatus Eisenbacteria bacterium]|nr:SsrA-binding protein SmpB [Candidatus Eisenbacteria bacterium]